MCTCQQCHDTCAWLFAYEEYIDTENIKTYTAERFGVHLSNNIPYDPNLPKKLSIFNPTLILPL